MDLERFPSAIDRWWLGRWTVTKWAIMIVYHLVIIGGSAYLLGWLVGMGP